MRKIAVFMLLLVACTAWTTTAAQSTAANANPKYLWIENNAVRPSTDAAAMAKYLKIFKDGAAPTGLHWLAEFPVSGRGHQLTFVTFLDDGSQFEKAIAEFHRIDLGVARQDPALHAQVMGSIDGTDYVLAKYEPEFSVRPETVDYSRLTRVLTYTYRLKPGMTSEFEGWLRQMRDFYATGVPDGHAIVWRMVAGGDPGFIVVLPMNNLAELDKPQPNAAGSPFVPMVRKQLDGMLKEAAVSETSELFVIDPALSNPPESYIAANPDFWNVKQEEMAAATVTKGKKIKAAAMKEK